MHSVRVLFNRTPSLKARCRHVIVAYAYKSINIK